MMLLKTQVTFGIIAMGVTLTFVGCNKPKESGNKLASVKVYEAVDIQKIEGPLSFVSVKQVADNLSSGPVSVDGKEVSGVLFKGVLVSMYLNDNGVKQFGNRCTSTIVGKDVVLTAAHCIDAGAGTTLITLSKTYDMSIDVDGKSYTAKCSMHPDYSKEYRPAKGLRNSRDIALCKLGGDSFTVGGAGNEYFENINLQHLPIIGNDILVGGYGCFGRKKPDGKIEIVSDWDSEVPAEDQVFYYRIGDTKITNMNTFDQIGDGGAGTTTWSRFDSKSKLGDNLTDICQGDSGGAVFFGTDFNSASTPNTSRGIIGVNSGNAIKTSNQTAISAFTNFAHPEIRKWIPAWAKQNNVQICGVSKQSQGCKPK